ncbi:BTB/POZ domain-containing protein 6-like [Nilaparvata lugens]|uniref:BTB/POZ domain-containing protein 6-like n=1 Tax=Nilaparvata lugens TaxID=108931 RepID=UPI00193E8FF5|nr:BTB/POZ domain-containing protein 6-like [Nilaparvata lugens]
MESDPLSKPDKTCKIEKGSFDRRFHQFYDSDITSDCEFLVGNEKSVIKGHKLVFSAASTVFYAKFYGDLKENSVVELSDLEPEGFKKMKQYIYTGEVSFETYDQIIYTLVIGKKYSIPTLATKCMELLEEGKDTYRLQALKYYEYLNERSISELNQLCERIVEENTFDILSKEGFLSAKHKTVGWILGFESLALTSEVELFNFVEKWALAKAKPAIPTSAEGFNHIKKDIRFLTMDGEQFADVATKTTLLTDGEKLAISLNLLKFGSTSLPEYLSNNRKERNFTRKQHS